QAPLLSTHTTAAPISTPPLHDALPISVVTAATTAIGATGRLGRRLATGLVIHTHGQGNPFTGNVHFHHFNLNDITRLHHFARILDRKSTRLNSSHVKISYAVFCLKKKT